MTGIDSNITFENGKIAKCVLKIAGGKTFTVTLGNRGYEVIEGGNVTASSAASPSTPAAATPGSTPAATPGSAPGSASTSAPSQQKNEYNTQKDLIEKLGPHGYKSLV
tara:strand:+ start:956 stop:1279 length:324 start_codon:yes stop_codon:yes gene_type:complete